MNLPQSHKTLGNLARALFSINILYVITYLYRISVTSLGDSFGKLGTDFFFFKANSCSSKGASFLALNY